MSHSLGDRLFTYAVITDTHLNQSETECNSPFQVNKLANARMRHVVQDLNARDVEFVLHLGDLLHPVPALPHLYDPAAECFKEQVRDLRHKLYLIPGNHDVGDKPVDWCPAGMVRDDFLKLYEKHFGPHYQAFDHGPIRLILIDAQIINSGLKAEAKQKAWLEKELAAANRAGKRIFLNSHYPPYLTFPDEGEHYDNIGEPGRSWLLSLMKKHKVEAFFAGHVHNFWIHRHGNVDCYLLPSTAFVRQDYAEMYRAVPKPEMEQGRNDAAKLGYFLVHVHEKGHLCEMVRTYGKTARPGGKAPKAVARVAPVHPIENPNDRFGFDMRQNWLEVIEIPPSGGLDEFDRKRTRNDYPLMALLEMGVRRVRIPARDRLDPAHRERLAFVARHGIRFTLFSFGKPDRKLKDAVIGAKGLIDRWEIAQFLSDLPAVAKAALPTAKAAGAALYLSKLRGKDEMLKGGEQYYHMINHGFTVDEVEQIAPLAKIKGVAGLVFRVAGEMSPWKTAKAALKICGPLGLRPSLHVRLSRGSPGVPQEDEAWVAMRTAEALAAAAAFPGIDIYPDAFADVDRGYFSRQGVVDRLYNPRPACHVLRHMNAALARAEGQPFLLVGAGRKPLGTAKGKAKGMLVDLATGRVRPGKMKAKGVLAPAPKADTLTLWVGEP